MKRVVVEWSLVGTVSGVVVFARVTVGAGGGLVGLIKRLWLWDGTGGGWAG